jgi:hypothetical protein
MSEQEAVNQMQQALEDSAARLDGVASAMQEVIALFDAGALSGEHGERWRAQVQDKVLPFITRMQDTLRTLGSDLR